MPHAVPPLRPGHHLQLLEGSREFFPALIAAIDAARTEVLLETYIFDFTGGAAEVAYALERAARRGVMVRVVADGYGSVPPPAAWEERFLEAGVEWRMFRRIASWDLLWPASWRRLHRKLCVIDGAIAFCGGINILDDFYDPNHGALELPRFDFAVQVRGPVAGYAHLAVRRLWLRFADVKGQGRLTGA